MKKKYLIDFFKKENNEFSFEEFFKDDINIDKRGIVVITNTEIIKTKTLPTDDNKGMIGHDQTYDYLTYLLYDINFDKDDNLMYSKENEMDNQYYLTYLQYYQNIMIRFCNEGVNHLKLVWVHLPPTVTKTQFMYLEELNNETKQLFSLISNQIYKLNEERLVAFNDHNDNKIEGDNLDCVIEYIKNNNLIKDNDYIIDEKNFIQQSTKVL